MLRDFIKGSLSFPELVLLEKGIVRNPESTGDLYKLKWPGEKYKIGVLPEGCQWVNDLVFCLDDKYLKEIRRTCQRAAEEWAMRRSFDTCVREMCLKPAISFVATAFYLLCDTIYEEDGREYDPHSLSRRYLAKYLLGFQFWVGQTGSGLVVDHCGIYDKYLRDMSLSRVKSDHHLDIHELELRATYYKLEAQIKKLYPSRSIAGCCTEGVTPQETRKGSPHEK
jgi:hypothetical protein